MPVKSLLNRIFRYRYRSQGNRTTPSYVAFTDTERLIGDAAKNQVRIATCSFLTHVVSLPLSISRLA